MITFHATSFQFGGAIISTDDPLILDRIIQLLDTCHLIAIQLAVLLMRVNPAVSSLELLCKRLLLYLDAAELVATMPEEIWRRMVLAMCPVGYGPG
jgi:precorrin-6B methylase 1